MNVFTGTVLMKAQEKVTDIYSSPRRKRYCVRVNLIDIKSCSVIVMVIVILKRTISIAKNYLEY